MPIHKDFKRMVRARMQKTGESYTTARAQLLRAQPRLAARAAALAPIPTAPAAYAALAGMSDAAVKKATGCTWDRWVFALDHVKAYDWPHRAIAEYVHEKYKVPDWWTQMVTVGYERIRGLRDRGQRRGGAYEASKSKVFDTPLGRLYTAFASPKMRARWLDGAELTVRRATRNRSMRVTWADGTSVELWFTSRGRSKSQVQVQCTRLESRDAAAKKTRDWEERLAALDRLLASPVRRTR